MNFLNFFYQDQQKPQPNQLGHENYFENHLVLDLISNNGLRFCWIFYEWREKSDETFLNAEEKMMNF